MSTPTVPSGLTASDVGTSTLSLAWNQSTNPGTIMTSGPAAGAWFGWGGGTKSDIVYAEATLGRKVDYYRTNYSMTGRAADSFPTPADEAMYSGGKIPGGPTTTGGRLAVWGLTTKVGAGTNPTRYGYLTDITPAGSSVSYGGNGTNNVWTYAQISAGALDDYWRSEFDRVSGWGQPCWFTFDWETTGNARTIIAGGAGGTNPDRAAAGTLAEFIDAWQHIKAIATDRSATNVSWLLTLDGAEKALSVYQAAYPGDTYVDWIGWTMYNNPAPGGTWRSFADTADNYGAVTITTPALSTGAGDKPVMIAETGCNYDPAHQARRGEWLSGIADGIVGLPTINAVTYWNANSANTYTALNVATYAAGQWSATSSADTNAWAALTTEVAKSAFKQSHEGGTGVAGYNVYADANPTSIATTTGQTSTTAQVSGYTAGSTHSFQVSSFDSSGSPVESALSTALRIQLASQEAVAPEIPTDFRATPISSTQVRLLWTKSVSTGFGVGGYRIYRDGDLIAQVTPGTTVTYAATRLDVETTYDFAVTAGDQSLSAWSDPTSTVSVTTQVEFDLTPPSGPSSLTASAFVSANTNSPMVVLTWNASQDDMGVSGYNVYRDSVFLTKLPATTLRYEDIGRRPDTDYVYAVSAYDQAKNESVFTTASVTTPTPSSTSPLAVLAVTPTTGIAPLAITADASASVHPQDLAMTYTFHFGDGPAIGPGSFAAMGNTYVTAGDYIVTVTATDQNGYSDSASVPVSVGTGEDRTSELNLYLPRPGDLLTSKPFWDQVRSALRTIDQAIYDLRNP